MDQAAVGSAGETSKVGEQRAGKEEGGLHPCGCVEVVVGVGRALA